MLNDEIRQLLIEQATYELARRDFWEYCKIKAPDFYKEDRKYLKEFCYTLQDFYYGEKKVLVVNAPPRHGKTRTISLFVQWVLGQNIHYKVMTGSYNEIVSAKLARGVRNPILEANGLYSKIFPNTKIKYGESAVNMWALEGNEESNYLATSPGGTATGFGCNLMIIDDLIKNKKEAFNERLKQEQIEWFTDTMLSRTETGFKIIIVMTRWATDDLAGYILENFDCVHINYKAVQDDGTMLCEEVLSKEDFDFKTKDMDRAIVQANYQQEPIDVKGKLYSRFKTYVDVPKDDDGNVLFKFYLNYTDTADTGDDYLCSINYGMYNDAYYILDVVYTQDAMEITEPMVAKMLTKDNIGSALIESNNGGRGFARNVDKECKALGNKHTVITWFHQSENKQARIFSNSSSVMNNVYFPVNWADLWPEFYLALNKYQREGKNEHDDGPDALTGVYENPKPKNNWLI